jgi:hypothetical protein
MYRTRSNAKLIKLENKSINKNYSKDSFDRFGDDLCQLLLSYLSVEQKFRFECVSKQWKSLIFNKQQKLILDFYEVLNNKTLKTPKNEKKYDLMFKTLFKKLKFLTDIECHHFFNSSTINSIINNCLFVEKIAFNGNINENLLLKLSQTFGKRLISFDLSGVFNKKFDDIFTFTPNLKEIKLNKNLDQLIKTVLTKLEMISFPKNVDLVELKTFTDIYCKQIKKISASFGGLPNDVIDKSLIQLSRYENLESLSLNIKLTKKRALFIDSGLVMIGNKCKKLKHFNLKAYYKVTNENLFLILSRFEALTKLIIHFQCPSDQSFGNMHHLNGCTNLKYLNLFVKSLTDQNFNDIHKYLPNLKYFSLLSDNKLTQNTLFSLSKLQNLTRLEMKTSGINDCGAREVINNCPQIRTIIFDTHIKDIAIRAFVDLALKNPKNQYIFVFRFTYFSKFTIDEKDIPNNLSIIDFDKY